LKSDEFAIRSREAPCSGRGRLEAEYQSEAVIASTQAQDAVLQIFNKPPCQASD
jgi:hypothetical protein